MNPKTSSNFNALGLRLAEKESIIEDMQYTVYRSNCPNLLGLLVNSLCHNALDESLYTKKYEGPSVGTKLTAAKVKSIKEAGKYPDANGLFLIVSKTLNKSWVYRYQLNNRRRDMGLGKYPTISLSDARDLRDEAAKLVTTGIDPLDQRNAYKAATTSKFESLAERFIDNQSKVWTNKKHVQQWRNTLATYAYPFIGDKAVVQITTAMVAELLEPIWLEKPETATRVRSRIENVIDYAIAMGHSDRANPAAMSVISKVLPTVPKSKRVKHFAAMPYQDVPAFYSEIADRISLTAQALKLTILTACRTSDALGATWAEFQGDVWVVSAERMKIHKEQRYPLCDGLLDLIGSFHHVNRWVFPSIIQSKDTHLSNMSMLKFLKDEMGQNYTVHGFRSSFRDWVEHETDFDTRLAEVQLAHTLKNKTEAAYQRGDLLEKRKALMQAWFNYVTENYEME